MGSHPQGTRRVGHIHKAIRLHRQGTDKGSDRLLKLSHSRIVDRKGDIWTLSPIT